MKKELSHKYILLQSWINKASYKIFLHWLLLSSAFFIQIQDSFSQSPLPQNKNGEINYAVINKIYIEGNKRTKDEIILRELDFSVGDTILLSQLSARIKENEFNVMNTGLFTAALFSFKEWEGATNKIGLNIAVKEDWYVFPFPIVELADRNFNVWWTDYNHSLKRLNLGLRFYHTNVTGRRDLLKTVVQFGFTKKYELIYTLPGINKSSTVGANFNILHTREKEIGFTTFDNELLFHRNDKEILLKRFRIGAGLIFRPQLDVVHQLDFKYRAHSIHESIANDLNPDFFLGGTKQEYISLSYLFSIDKRDIRPYPMNGYLFSASLSKNGLGLTDDIKSFEAIASIQQYFSIKEKWSVALAAKGKYSLQRDRQPYYTSRALGYENDFIRGYEYYVIDGLDYAFHKQALRFNFFNKTFNWGRYMKYDSFKEMPIKLFLVVHNELGFVNNQFYKKDNPLSNTWLWGTGLGLDIVMYYNKVFNLEYSRNHLGEHGFFLHWTFSF